MIHAKDYRVSHYYCRKEKLGIRLVVMSLHECTIKYYYYIHVFEVALRLVKVGLLQKEHKVDFGWHAAYGNGDVVKQLGEFVVVASGEEQVMWYDANLVVLSLIALQLHHLWFKEHTETMSITNLSSTRRTGMGEMDVLLVT